MKISGVSYQPYPYQTRVARRNEKIASEASAFTATGTKQGSTGSKNIDLRSATAEEFNALAAQLYKDGTISLKQLGVMTLDPTRSPQGLKIDLNVTKTDSAGRRDWVREFEARTERNVGLGNTLGAKNTREIAQILKKIDAAQK